MSDRVIWVRSYAERLSNGQWQAFCVTFNLAAQGESLRDVRATLESMVKEYLNDAIASEASDPAHVAYLLGRRAPFYFRAKYWLVWLRLRLHAFATRREPYLETFTFATHAC